MTENNQSTSNVDDYQVCAIDKQFWIGKTKITLNDMERAHGDLINLQDGLNRSIRHINRKAQANFDAINRLANSVNLNSATVEAQIKSLVERIDRLDQFDNNSLEEIDGQQQLNRSERLNYTLIRPNPFVDENPENNNQIFTLTGITGLDVFSQESVSAFDKWSRRFRDYLAVMCGNMNEQQKLDRLRLALDDTPRDLYDKLSAAETATVEDALRALKYKLDSPQRKELAKRSLGLCKQREDESVAYSNLGPVQLKERLCEEFLDRLKPDLSFLIRLAGLSREKDLELVRTQAEELELLLKTHKGQAPEMFSQAIQAIERNPQMMSSSGQFNNNQNTRQLQEQRGFQQRNYPRRKTTAPMPNEGQKRFKGNWNNNPNNERKWNSRPVCNFCKKTGHFAFNCFQRRRQFNQNWRPGVNAIQNACEQPGPSYENSQSNMVLAVNELVKTVSAMKLQPSNSKSARESEIINSISHNIQNTSENKNKVIENKTLEKVEKEKEPEKRPKVSNWEGIGPKLTRFLMIISILLIILAVPSCAETTSYMPKHPMICQNVRNGVLWAVPTLQECPRVSLNYTEPPVIKTLWLFAPNNFQQETSAWACRKIRKSIRKFTSITNVNIKEQLDSESLEIATEECREMIYRKKCKIGTLIEEDGLWHTNVKIDNSPRTWLLGSWDWKTVSSENCYLVPTKIFSKFGDKSITSPLGDIQDCSYLKGSGKQKYAQDLERIGDHVLASAISAPQLFESLDDQQKNVVNRYIRACRVSPRMANEGKVAQILLSKEKRRIVYCTLSLAEQIGGLFEETTVIVCDEAGQASFAQFLSTLTNFPKLNKLLIAGDRRQLSVYLEEFPEAVRNGLGLDTIIWNLDEAPGVDRATLEINYRSHPEVTACIEAGAYAAHNERLTPGRTAAEMDRLTGQTPINLPCKNMPLVLIHQTDPMVQDPTSFSASNPEQTRTVVDLLMVLRTRFTGTVRVICFYAGQAKEVGVALAEREMADIIVSTADGCQGHEADLAIVVTTKAGLTTVDGSGAFWNDERRVNVALSRGKFGMVVIGDFKMLWTAGGIWRRFLKKALEKTVAVTPDYIEAMADPEAEYENGVLVGPNGTVRASNFYDEWKEHDSNISQEVPASEFANLGFGQPSTSQPTTSRRSGQQPRLCHRCRRSGHLAKDCLENSPPRRNERGRGRGRR
uniref:CCHC-type domain-containing protein n=1 Tax=Meloidogyne incognita TaxID=6306 RepID=A0A914KMS8_MELIC